MEKKNYVVGVDIGSSSVVVMVGVRQPDGNVCIDGVAIKKVGNGVSEGRITNVCVVGQAIREAKEELEKELNIRIKEANAGISGNFIRCTQYTDHVFVKDVVSRCISNEDISALHERMENIQADSDETIMDKFPIEYWVDDKDVVTNPVGSFGRKVSTTFLFILGKQQELERVRLAFQNAGIKLKSIYANSAIIHKILLSEVECDEGTAIFDIGSGVTDVSIIRKGKLRHISSIPIGASSIDADLHSFGIAERFAEKVKKNCACAIAEKIDKSTIMQIQAGSIKKDIPKWNLVAIIEARLQDIAEFAWEEVKRAKFSSKIACGIVLSGGCAFLDDIGELFERETKTATRLGNVKNGISEESRDRIGSFTQNAAVAIVVKSAEDGKFCDVIDCATPVRPAVTEPKPVIETPVANQAAKPADNAANTPADSLASQTDSQDADYEDEPKQKKEKKKGGLLGQMGKFLKMVIGENEQDYL